MSWPTIRSDGGALRALVVGTGLCWSLAFVVIALHYRLQLYADGAMFSYAVAVQDVWAFHWHNISGRLSVFLLCLWPAESYVGLTGNANAGIAIYGFLFYVAPLLGLIGTFAADRSRGRVFFVTGCASTALLCPLIFGFPTEMCLAHALFWPTLTVSHCARRTVGGTLLAFAMMLLLAFSHEGALVLAFAIVASLLPRGFRDATLWRAAAIFFAILALSAAAKLLMPPDDYYAGVFLRAALHFFDPAIFQVSVVLLLLAALVGFALLSWLLSRWTPDRAYLVAAAIVAVLLMIYWRWFDRSVHADGRYYLRTALVIFTPVFGTLAALAATDGDGKLPAVLSSLQHAISAATHRGARPLVAGFVLLTLVHVVETGKFVAAWKDYGNAIAALAAGHASDPALGDARFVSSQRIPSDVNRLSWFSTTPYLSVIAADFKPNRLVIDPSGNYFWLSCATATANAEAPRAIPANARELVRVYSCLHR